MTVHGLDGVLDAARLGEERAWFRLYGRFAPFLLGYFGVKGCADAEARAGETIHADEHADVSEETTTPETPEADEAGEAPGGRSRRLGLATHHESGAGCSP